MIAVALLVWVAAEIVAIVAVAHLIGVLLTILALIAGWPLGTWLMRAEGAGALTRLRSSLAAGRPPGPELVDGALGLLGGALFVVPGFVTDAAGLLLLVAPLRRRLATVALRRLGDRVARRGGSGGGRGFGARRPGAGRGGDVDSTARDVTPIDRHQLHG